MSKNLKMPSRDAFREAVLSRDGGQCVLCGNSSADAYHILDQRLWTDGGYDVDNGVSLCHEHHRALETTAISVEAVRTACGIIKPILPDHLYLDETYDTWGNILLTNGQRLKGDLFFDISVQEALAIGGVLDLFTNRVKYPRTFHAPWSEGAHDDDRMHATMSGFEGERVIVTEKYDGECTTLYSDGLHARSIDSRHHVSRDWIKQFWSGFAHDIPQDWRICGENLFAKHSIQYTSLPTYFMGFSIWNERNICLSWEDTLTWFSLFGITPVSVLYDGIYNEKLIKALYSPSQWNTKEGYVIRKASAFSYGQFRSSVAKFVRKGHVTTTQHWMQSATEKNLLA